jgi:inorganic phosphate transporter, PiT family
MPIELLASGLLLFALAFVFVTGANDGGVLIAMGIRHAVLPVAWFILILVLTLVAAPLLFGLSVARTLALGLLPQHSQLATAGFFIGIAVALVLVGALSRIGLPTSLTLAIIGGVTGAGLGLGLSVSWSVVVRVLAVGALAPVVGGLIGLVLARFARYLPTSSRMPQLLARAHVVAFVVQCVAYAINDGQKMVAVAAVAGLALTGHLTLLDGGNAVMEAVTLAVIAVVFVAGMLSTVRSVSQRIGLDLVPVAPLDAVVAQYASAAAVLASSAVGVPVSMTQSVAAGLVGASGSRGMRRVRWHSVTRIAAAWMVTLPAAAAGACGVGLLVHATTG